MVYYRKYRPQTIEELDNKKVRETLFAVLKGKDIPHAFLFTGPKGLGKTSAARIVAKAVNCLHEDKKKSSIEPDNTCEQCVSITSGTNIDVLEIDGASNRGIDEIRDLREKVKLAPAAAKKKVYIIDEVHMLTTEAFNALLKTIEEPPAHVMFIFCTTEPHKVPATIMSRCFHVSFSLATTEEIVGSLKRIVTGEKIKISTQLLEEISKMADGGFRDASKILEELVALHGKDIKDEHFQITFHTASISSAIYDFLDALSHKKTERGLKIVTELTSKGIDLKFYIYKLLSILHTMLLEKTQVEKETTAFTKEFSLDELTILNDLFAKVYLETKSAVIPQLPLEIAIIKYTSSNSQEGSQNTLPAGRQEFAVTEGQPTIESLKKKQQADKVQAIIKGSPLRSASRNFDVQAKTSMVTQHDMHSNRDEKTALMENLIYKVKPFNHSVAGVLRGCKIKDFNSKSIVFETAYKFHKERLEESKSFEIIERAIKEITGKKVKVEIILKGR